MLLLSFSTLWRKPLQALRRHPWLGGLVILLLLGGAAAAGVWAWGRWQLRAAEQALRDEQWDEARRHVELCLAVWPWSRDGQAHLLAARAERLADRYREAEAELNECQRLRGGSDEAIQLEWLLLRAQRGKIDQVFPGLWQYVEEGRPDAAAVLQTLSRIYTHDFRPAPALRCLTRWLELEPDNAWALEWHGRMEQLVDDPAAAARDFGRAVELQPDRYEARYQLVESLLSQSTAREALPHVEDLRLRYPDRADVLVALARCRDLEGQPAEARRLVRDVLAAHAEHAQALALRGKLDLEARRPVEAEKWLRRAAEADPGNLAALRDLHRCLEQQPGRERDAARALARRAETEKERKRLEQLLRSEAGGPAVFLEGGRLALRTGREKLGLRWLHLALEQDPNLKAAHQALAEYYEGKGQLREAAEQWWLARQATPTAAPAGAAKSAGP